MDSEITPRKPRRFPTADAFTAGYAAGTHGIVRYETREDSLDAVTNAFWDGVWHGRAAREARLERARYGIKVYA